MVKKADSTSKSTKTSSVEKNDDISIVEESFKLVKSLNEEVKKIHENKKKLSEDIKKLDHKIAKKEKNPLNKDFAGKFLAKIKDDILKDVAPLLDEKLVTHNVHFSKKHEKIVDKFIDNHIKTHAKKLKDKEKSFEENIVKIKNDLLVLVKDYVKSVDKELAEVKNKLTFDEKSLPKLVEEKVANSKKQLMQELIALEKKIEEANYKEFISNINEQIKNYTRDVESVENKLSERVQFLSRETDEKLSSLEKFAQKEIKEIEKVFVSDKKVIDSKLNNIDSNVEKIEAKFSDKVLDLASETQEKLQSIQTFAQNEIKEFKESFTSDKKLLDSKLKEVDTTVEKIKEVSLENLKRAENKTLTMLEGFANEAKSKLKDIETRLSRHERDYEKVLEKRMQTFRSDFNKENKTLKKNIDSKFAQKEKDFKLLNKKVDEKFNQARKENEEKLKSHIYVALEDTKEEISKKTIDLNNFFIKTSQDLTELEKDFGDKIEDKLLNSIKQFKGEIEVLEVDFFKKLEVLEEDKRQNIKELESFKKEIGVLTKNYVQKLDSKLTETKFEEDRAQALFEQIIDKIQANYEEKEQLLLEQVSSIKSEFTKEIGVKEQELLSNLSQIVKEKDKILEQNEKFKSKVNEDKKKIAERFEKLLVSKEEKFGRHIEKKEAKFLKDLKVIDEEKNRILKLVELLKQDFARSNEIYDEKLQEKINELEDKESKILANLKDYETKVNSRIDSSNENYNKELEEKLEFLAQRESEILDSLKSYEKEAIENVEKKEDDFETEKDLYLTQIKGVIEQERREFFLNENSFKIQFKENLNNINESIEKRLEDLEKKFLEDNLNPIRKAVVRETANLRDLVKGLEIRESSILKKENDLESMHQEVIEHINQEAENAKNLTQMSINESYSKVESRIVELEKQFNRRFLDYQSDISSFKGVVVDEVEGIIKNLNTNLSQKVKQINSQMSKIKQIDDVTIHNLETLSSMKQDVEFQLRDLRDNLQDVGVNVSLLQNRNHSLQNHIGVMSSYEEQLIGLIESLKVRGLDKSQILDVLVSKNHPRFYVMTILNSFDNLLDKPL